MTFAANAATEFSLVLCAGLQTLCCARVSWPRTRFDRRSQNTAVVLCAGLQTSHGVGPQASKAWCKRLI